MGNDLIIAAETAIMSQEQKFESLARIHNAVNFKTEASFALQVLKKNNYLLETAMRNKDSLLSAVINVAAIGLTLNPAHQYAYIIPRDGQVCLDISYRGLIQIACETGSILWASAEIVCEHDSFSISGQGNRPVHKFEPFKERGEIIGAYCVAKTRDGEYLTTVMSIKDIVSIRDRSASWNSKKGPSGPWVTDFAEMVKKTVIKRAFKTWPKVEREDRLNKAIEVENQVDPIDFSRPIEKKDLEAHESLVLILSQLPGAEAKLIKHVSDKSKRNIASIDDFTNDELKYSISFLSQYAGKKKDEKVEPKTVVATVTEIISEEEKQIPTVDVSSKDEKKPVTKIEPDKNALSADQIAKAMNSVKWED